MNIKDLHNVYFLGIGGIGMSALARWFHHHGYQVSGYDRTQTPLTDQLGAEGIDVHFEDDLALIPKKVLQEKDQTLIVYTPAIPKDNIELLFFQREGFLIKKRAEVLGMLTEDFFTVAVAGTHGKTTTSSMIAHILTANSVDSTAFLGGITQNYNSNIIYSQSISKATIAVVEADEFDRSFLQLSPDFGIITSVDPDHLDIYGNHAGLQESFQQFACKVPGDGKLFVNQKVQGKFDFDDLQCRITWYGLEEGDVRAENIRIKGNTFTFDYVSVDQRINDILLPMAGFHNVENATAAILVALQLGLSGDAIKGALSTYKGVKRRFEYVMKTPTLTFIDDYAHHPSEITALLRSVRAIYPFRKVTAIFQPHLYSRTKDFADGFADSLNYADDVILLDIYPAREQPIPGITSDVIFKNIERPKVLLDKKSLIGHLEGRDLDVVLTIGAGDIDQLVTPIKETLERRL